MIFRNEEHKEFFERRESVTETTANGSLSCI